MRAWDDASRDDALTTKSFHHHITQTDYCKTAIVRVCVYVWQSRFFSSPSLAPPHATALSEIVSSISIADFSSTRGASLHPQAKSVTSKIGNLEISFRITVHMSHFVSRS